tara:strand:+ start:392 stop:841 length:450 start_codon:yes stop_codon:yes gene_type:complete
MIKRKFSISEQSGTPVAIAAASGGGTALFAQNTHHTTNKAALIAKTVATVGMADATNIQSYNGPVDVTLTFSSVVGTGVAYTVFISADGTNFAAKATGNVTANGTIVVEDVEAPYVTAYAQRIGTGTGSAICTVSGVREMYRNEMVQRS